MLHYFSYVVYSYICMNTVCFGLLDSLIIAYIVIEIIPDGGSFSREESINHSINLAAYLIPKYPNPCTNAFANRYAPRQNTSRLIYVTYYITQQIEDR